MVYLSVSLLLFFFASAFSGGADLLTPCDVHDTDCLSKTTQEFLEKTSAGIPNYNIKRLDPLVIPKLEIKLSEKSEPVLHFKDLTVTGLKGQQFSGFKMDTTAKTVELQTKADLDIVGEITLEMKKKSYTGSYAAKGTALGTAKYDYAFKTDDKGVEHYEIGTETNECQTLIDPQVTYDQELIQALEKDTDLQGRKQRYYANQKDIEQRIFCEIVSHAYKTVVHNIRAAAKILPKSAFLKGV
ncbi:juvenile hormone-binding protein-like [Danaus plexippus]|uniref:Juvenile hormone binding protein n=1 Tax=Danaus plexippus plexippus TaxID=278856 RepID=A0A212FF36_DANPL|nr:juvenile hormone-binding protein-like [Danaus plexippus]OWR52356.1 juvenile hormone binding protein [Danaus plexippus plexippus]